MNRRIENTQCIFPNKGLQTTWECCLGRSRQRHIAGTASCTGATHLSTGQMECQTAAESAAVSSSVWPPSCSCESEARSLALHSCSTMESASTGTAPSIRETMYPARPATHLRLPSASDSALHKYAADLRSGLWVWALLEAHLLTFNVRTMINTRYSNPSKGAIDSDSL